MPGRALRRAAPTRCAGGFTFAEHPGRLAPDARIIWHAAFDPGTLAATAEPALVSDPDAISLDVLAPWLTTATDGDGREHVVLSDGWHHIRLDIEEGRLAGETAVLLHYRLYGLAAVETRLLPLRRLVDLCRHGRFTRSLFPRDPRIDRGILMLRVHDALNDGASQREIGVALFGAHRIAEEWNDPSDSLRSRVRRLAREARAMAHGGYRQLMRGGR